MDGKEEQHKSNKVEGLSRERRLLMVQQACQVREKLRSYLRRGMRDQGHYEDGIHLVRLIIKL
jgi:hypothetical protein